MNADADSRLIAAIARLTPVLSKQAVQELEEIQELLRALPGESPKGKAKAAKSMMGILAMFPGLTPAEIEDSIGALLKESRSSVPVLARRAREYCTGTGTEDLYALNTDLKSLKTGDLKKLGKALGLSLAGRKADILADLKQWLGSRGRERPATPEEKSRQAARPYIERVRGLIDAPTSQNADRILAVAEEAYSDKALGKQGYAAFAKSLGLTVSGSKPTMRKQLREYVDKLAVSHTQTQF